MTRGFPVILACLTLLVASAAQAGAWLQPVGHGQWNVQATSYATDRYFDESGSLNHQRYYSKYELAPYAEYGLFENLTVGGTAYFQRDHQAQVSNIGVADPQLFARTNLWKGERQLVSLQPLIKFRSVFEQPGAPRGGTSSTDMELSLLYGRNLTLFTPNDYLDVRAGYRMRGGQLENQYLGDVALGLNISPHWQVIPAVRVTQAAATPDTTTFVENGDQDYSLIKVELGAAYKLDEAHWVLASVAAHVAGQQTGNGHSVTIGYAANF